MENEPGRGQERVGEKEGRRWEGRGGEGGGIGEVGSKVERWREIRKKV
jgi:hypothetical protein